MPNETTLLDGQNQSNVIKDKREYWLAFPNEFRKVKIFPSIGLTKKFCVDCLIGLRDELDKMIEKQTSIENELFDPCTCDCHSQDRDNCPYQGFYCNEHCYKDI